MSKYDSRNWDDLDDRGGYKKMKKKKKKNKSKRKPKKQSDYRRKTKYARPQQS